MERSDIREVSTVARMEHRSPDGAKRNPGLALNLPAFRFAPCGLRLLGCRNRGAETKTIAATGRAPGPRLAAHAVGPPARPARPLRARRRDRRHRARAGARRALERADPRR